MLCSGEVTQQSTRPACKDSTKEPPLPAQLLMPEGINAAPQALQPPRLDTGVDGSPTEPARLKLGVGDYTELLRRESGHGRFGLPTDRWRTFFMTVVKILRHRVSVARLGALGCCCL